MAPRFRAALLVGRQLTAEFEARDAQAAEDIARFLFENDRALKKRYGYNSTVAAEARLTLPESLVGPR